MKTWQGILFGLFSGLLAAALILIVDSRPRGDPVRLLPTYTPSPIVVYITGAVIKPGVYQLQPQSRIADLLQSAGGFAPSADQSAVNLAAKIKDGEKIVIPTVSLPGVAGRSETIDLNSDSTVPHVSPEIININLASSTELEQLPGIGSAKAQAIIDYRSKYGDFESPQAIQNVPGIGPGIFSQIEAFITTE